MKIAINAFYATSSNNGFHSHTLNYLTMLYHFDKENCYDIYVPDVEIFFTKWKVASLSFDANKQFQFFKLPFSKVEGFTKKFIVHCESESYDRVIHLQPAEIPRHCTQKHIVYLHDVIPLQALDLGCLKKEPFLFQVANPFLYQKYKKIVCTLQYAHLTATVSQYSKNKIEYFFDRYCLKNTKIFVHYNIINPPIKTNNSIEKSTEQLLVGKKYFFYFGGGSKRKNPDIIVSAFVQYNQKYNSNNFLVISCDDKTEKRLKKIVITKCKSQVLFIRKLSLDEIHTYSHNAIAYIYMSRIEGFGLPPIEAQSAKAAVICYSGSSLGEVCGKDGALFVHNQSVDELVEAMRLVETNENLRNQLKHNGFENVLRFTEEKSYLQYKELLAM